MPPKLSSREHEVLLWAARGKTYAEISMILNLSFSTIKTYLDTSRHKLQASNLQHAIAIAFARGLINADDITQRCATFTIVVTPSNTAISWLQSNW